MRVALGIEYDGTRYVGWQRQKSGVGVQAMVEKSIGKVADEAVSVICAGRTDTGVHATGQVVHFDTTAVRTGRGWLLGANSDLPEDVNVSWATPVRDDFHARFSATCRSYRYLILNRDHRSALNRHRAWWVFEPLDENAMQEAASHLVGEHDFSSFRAAGCQASTPVRNLSELVVCRQGDLIAITVRANAFLQHMVRNIAGTLVAVGRGDQQPNWVLSVLADRDRSKGGIAAPPHGLTLIGVEYPKKFGIPWNTCADEIRL
ncbi:MAG: tRNA pseudouridine(38-40) synthase TruA [Proteobacteria bacterium]|nr:tRNA pseudouridine(38-40) synthase TruA [Pseudomonadota bacterium]MDA0993934.1 tRNA pseudouridine(38-40) synthase TruA [Pseudomonadota bacterium]